MPIDHNREEFSQRLNFVREGLTEILGLYMQLECLRCIMAVIPYQDDWELHLVQISMAVEFLKARMEQVVEETNDFLTNPNY